MERILPTFCHINDYKERAYGVLHRMIAVSYPLVLWSPSATLQKHCYGRGRCRISVRELLEYVDRGAVQVVGRERWLLSRPWREQHAWKYAPWVEDFDDPLQAMCREDDRLPAPERRVRVVEEEDGYAWADRILEEEPDRARQIAQLVTRQRAPVGVRERASRHGGQIELVAREVLRDARNHARAIQLADVRVPFISRRDAAFFRVLETQGRSVGPYGTAVGQVASRYVAGISETALEVLRRLDQLQKPSTFRSFVGSEGHRELAHWLCGVTDAARYVRPRAIADHLLGDLTRRIAEKHPGRDLGTVLGLPVGRIGRSAFLAGLSVTIAALCLDPSNLLGVAGLAVAIVPVVTGISRRLGLVPLDYAGPQWPFLYAFGRPPARGDLNILRRILDELSVE